MWSLCCHGRDINGTTGHWHGVNGSYQPMRKQGAIILGTGGDNSNGAIGNFYEGYIASGVSSAATDDAIQKNIIAVGYKTAAG